MAARDYFSHTSQDGTTFDERVTAAGYTWTAVGENIAAGQRNAGSVVADWMSSPGHCRNIMSKSFTHLGVGVYYDANSSYGIYWTNDFGKGKSKAVSDVVPRALTVAVPKISGTAKVGKKLTAKAGAWGPKPVTLTYQWYRNGKKIAKATTSTYTLKAADKGKKITVKVTGKKKGYATASKTSKPTSKVA
ncbi:MAG: CAP domain-containing protein [Tessaracoccus sp.]|uniref:CAP domain-containing protein n=1 Tax=Tessaracoccus sp. TaxID=1971211 RepID=UPI001ED51181|nr:CAP domain-containing protein [Tessaracoccus sp.]MBK7822101.1 CAP domain-containing protein [Tessaracoccus sp.]